MLCSYIGISMFSLIKRFYAIVVVVILICLLLPSRMDLYSSKTIRALYPKGLPNHLVYSTSSSGSSLERNDTSRNRNSLKSNTIIANRKVLTNHEVTAKNKPLLFSATKFREIRSKNVFRGFKKSSYVDSFTYFDRICHKECLPELPFKGDCKLMNRTGRDPVGLFSLPGSGNTWVRGLLERATGICTGAVYCDKDLRRSGFDGENLRGGSVLVVKTHSPHLLTWAPLKIPQLKRRCVKARNPTFGAAILLLRNPYHALVSEWNRQLKSHTGIVNNQDYFVNNRSWNNHVIGSMTNKWMKYFNDIIVGSPPTIPKLIIIYEDIQRNRVKEISRILDFLHFEYSEHDLIKRLSDDYNTFHRSHHVEFYVFTESQKRLINHCITKAIYILKSRRSSSYGIEKYLRPLTQRISPRLLSPANL